MSLQPFSDRKGENADDNHDDEAHYLDETYREGELPAPVTAPTPKEKTRTQP
jgi:hypothetical protein